MFFGCLSSKSTLCEDELMFFGCLSSESALCEDELMFFGCLSSKSALCEDGLVFFGCLSSKSALCEDGLVLSAGMEGGGKNLSSKLWCFGDKLERDSGRPEGRRSGDVISGG